MQGSLPSVHKGPVGAIRPSLQSTKKSTSAPQLPSVSKSENTKPLPSVMNHSSVDAARRSLLGLKQSGGSRSTGSLPKSLKQSKSVPQKNTVKSVSSTNPKSNIKLPPLDSSTIDSLSITTDSTNGSLTDRSVLDHQFSDSSASLTSRVHISTPRSEETIVRPQTIGERLIDHDEYLSKIKNGDIPSIKPELVTYFSQFLDLSLDKTKATFRPELKLLVDPDDGSPKVTIKEAFEIWRYTLLENGSYEALNSFLRNPKQTNPNSQAFKESIQILTAGLSKLESTPNRLVFRGMAVNFESPNPQMTQYIQSMKMAHNHYRERANSDKLLGLSFNPTRDDTDILITEKSFLSTAASIDSAFGGGCLVVIQTKTDNSGAKNISAFSGELDPNVEQEQLFKPKSQFAVTKFVDDEENVQKTLGQIPINNVDTRLALSKTRYIIMLKEV